MMYAGLDGSGPATAQVSHENNDLMSSSTGTAPASVRHTNIITLPDYSV